MWGNLLERLRQRQSRRPRRIQEILSGEYPFYAHPRAAGERAERALATMLPVLQSSPRQGLIRARAARPRRAAPQVSLSIGPRRLIIHHAAHALGTGDLPASFRHGDQPDVFFLQERAAKPLARDLNQLICQLGDLGSDYRFDCFWGAPWPADEAPQRIGPVTPTELAHEAATEFGIALPPAYLEQLGHQPTQSLSQTSDDEPNLHLLELSRLVEENRALRNIPALEGVWRSSWWAVASDTWGNWFFIDTYDTGLSPVFILDHGMALEPGYDPTKAPHFASLKDLRAAANAVSPPSGSLPQDRG